MVTFAGSQGNFELNAMRPIIINNFLHSARILGDGCEKFRLYSVEGTKLNEKRIGSVNQLGNGAHPQPRCRQLSGLSSKLLTGFHNFSPLALSA